MNFHEIFRVEGYWSGLENFEIDFKYVTSEKRLIWWLEWSFLSAGFSKNIWDVFLKFVISFEEKHVAIFDDVHFLILKRGN